MAVNIVPYNQLEISDRITACLMDVDGWDSATGAYMRASRGKRKHGRPKRYRARYGTIIVRFTAHDDNEAANKANKKLNAKYYDELEGSKS